MESNNTLLLRLLATVTDSLHYLLLGVFSIQQHGLGVFDNKVLRKTFRLQNNKVRSIVIYALQEIFRCENREEYDTLAK